MEQLLAELEDLVGSDDFEFASEDIMEQIIGEGAGIEIAEDLLAIMERHPLDDFGMPGAMVRFIERFFPDYIPYLIASVRRAPALHTVWMLNRCINGSSAEDKEKYIGILEEVAENDRINMTIRKSAKDFLTHRTAK